MKRNWVTTCVEQLKEKSRYEGIEIAFSIDGSEINPINKPNLQVLILLEPPSVMPENYSKKKWRFFDLVILLSPWRSSLYGHTYSIFQPITRPFKNHTVNYSKDSSVCMINDFKFGSVKSSLYGWRLELLRKLEEKGLEVKVFGPNWQMSKLMEIRKRFAASKRAIGKPSFDLFEAWSSLFFRPSGYCGHSPDKLNTLTNHEYSIVIENDLYSLTEKLFDSVFAGNKVFYHGPQLDQFEFLEGLCFQLPESVEEATEVILQRENIEWSAYQKNVRNFTMDQGSMVYFSENFIAERVFDIIKNSEAAKSSYQSIKLKP